MNCGWIEGESNGRAFRQGHAAGHAGEQPRRPGGAGKDGLGTQIFGMGDGRSQALVSQQQVFWTNAGDQGALGASGQHRAAGAGDHQPRLCPLRGEQVHRRRADEAGGEMRRRRGVEFGRRRVLLHPPVAQQHDLVGHAHRLGLVVGDIEHGDAQPALQREQFPPHLRAQLRVQVGERFVHQADRRLGDDRAAERHALLLSAGKLARAAGEQMADAQHLRCTLEPARALGLGNAPRLQAEENVLRHRQMREQRIGLEHHRHPTGSGGKLRNVASADFHTARGRAVEPCDDAQAGGLAAARRPEQHAETARADMQRHPGQRRGRPPHPRHVGQAHLGARADRSDFHPGAVFSRARAACM